MTAKKIMETALHHFAQNGYEGASLSDISAEVGIKKPSIYNHFKGKDELFMAVYQDVAAKELSFVEEYLKPDSKSTFKSQLYDFLIQYMERYESEEETKFFLRMSFFPPTHLRVESMKLSMGYIDKMTDLAKILFASAANRGSIRLNVSIEQATGAYMAILDSVFVEMLYGDKERARKRLEASWHVFWQGVRQEEQK